MKKWLACLGLIVMAQNSIALEWLTDVHVAMDKAHQENKTVLLDFTGSDWCGWCMRLKSEVFDQPEFAAFAQANLVMVEVDFPRNKPQSAEQTMANEALAKNYKINGYPTIVLINPMAQEIGRTGYRPGGPKNFIAELEKIPGLSHGTGAVAAGNPTGTRHNPSTFVDLPAQSIITHYGDLTLKGVSGSKDRRMALINNETFLTGETAKVKVQDRKVEITCLEIRETSVLIKIDGKSQELKLGER
jgi:thioredoxin-related protein